MNLPAQSISLHIAGAPCPDADPTPGWTADTYALGGAARDAGVAPIDQTLPPDAVLELELADGQRLLVAAADAGRYLAGEDGRGGDYRDAARDFAVGPALRFGGVRPPAGLARDGIGAWTLKSLRIYRTGPAGMTALIAAGTFQDAALESRNGLYHCAPQDFSLSRVEALPAAEAPALLFIHGTASSTAGSFGKLWANDTYRARLTQAYGARIYALEHRSLTESPVANALALVKTLPQGARLHIVSHSRGGLVGELLARASRTAGEPFEAAEIERFAARGKRLGRAGYAEDAERLRELNDELLRRTIRVERFVRVACPARGTTLASGRLDRWASAMLNLIGKGIAAAGAALPALTPVAGAYGLFKNFLLAVVKERCNADVLPGLEAMMPDSPLVALLNGGGAPLAGKLHVVAGDFAGDGLLSWLGDCLTEAFYGGETDLVVNTPSMSGGLARAEGIFRKYVFGPEVTHFSYFERDASALPLLDALDGRDGAFDRLPGPSTALIARGGRKPMEKANAPIVLMLPGIMGSQIRLGENTIWFNPISMAVGRMAELAVDAAGKGPDGAGPHGWIDLSYERLANYLWETHEVRPFAYDWRLSMPTEAARFGALLDQAMNDAERRRQPLRIVAHSMGGLLARLALKERWERFKAIPGSRLLQLGTPNQGSHSIAAVLLGRDDFVKKIEFWADWKHGMREFLGIVSDFPGVLQLLPWPGNDGKASDGVDYFDRSTWENWHAADTPEDRQRWVVPKAQALQAARAAVAALQATPVDPACTLYVAGFSRDKTPVSVRADGQGIEIGDTLQGDGRVPWETGIPAGVPVWYVAAEHGDLPSHEPAFAGYAELLASGATRAKTLTPAPAGIRGSAVPVYRRRSTFGDGLYPSAAEVLAAALGASRPEQRPARRSDESPALVEVVHGSLAAADTLVLIGAYANDSLRGSAKFLDGHLEGQLRQAQDLGRYPGQPGEAAIFRHPQANARPAGALVVGLGALGELSPGELTTTLRHGLLEFARQRRHCNADERDGQDDSGATRLAISTLLVGTGFSGLTVETGVGCLLDAVRGANRRLAEAKVDARIGRLTVYEEAQHRAIAIALVLRTLAGQPRYAEYIRFDARVSTGEGGYRGHCVASGGTPGAYRVVINRDKIDNSLRFTLIGERARNEVYVEPSQRQAVDALIRTLTSSSADQPGLSRALFELMVPNALKESVGEVRTLMLTVDAGAAAYPWELMRDRSGSADGGDAAAENEPLAVRIELIRQLGSTYGSRHVPLVDNKRAFVVGDTQSGLGELQGARAEAQAVADAFERAGFAPPRLQLQANAVDVYQALFDDSYQFMHFAAHGVVEDKTTGLTGIVLGKDSILSPAQIKQLRHVPQFVFLNCCHLGAMQADAQARWGELAAGLATQLIELGCKAVIAAGWAVNDAAAEAFARRFYAEMLAGQRFGRAVLAARVATYRDYPGCNTWGAYQAYGDELYRFPVSQARAEREAPYIHPSHILADLEIIDARLKGRNILKKTNYVDWLETIERQAIAPAFDRAELREALASAWANLGETGRAIGHYRAALAMETQGPTLRALEQLANLEVRHGAQLAEQDAGSRDEGLKLMAAGRARIDMLLGIGATAERHSLSASYWKRLARIRQGVVKRGKPNVDACLQSAYDDYLAAAELSYRRTGEWDYYPLLNALDAAFLFAARGGQPSPNAQEIETRLAQACANAQRRAADGRNFFHAVALLDAERIRAQWRALSSKTKTQSILHAVVVDVLAARYRDLLNRMGSAREQQSAVRQLDDLALFLPDTAAGKAIKKALEELGRRLRG